MKYFVRAKKNFTDYLGKDINNNENEHISRVANVSEWWVDAKRYEYLKEHNAVELIEIIPIEKPKIETSKKKTTKKGK